MQRPFRSEASFTINDSNEDRPLIRTSDRSSLLQGTRKLALATANTLTAASPAMGVMAFMRLFPNVAPAAASYILATSGLTMLTGAGVAVADMTETERLGQLRLLWKAITSGFGAYMFSFESAVGMYVSIARLMGYSNDDINNGLANTITFAVLTTSSAVLGSMHAGVKYKNERNRNQIAKFKRDNPTDVLNVPKPTFGFLFLENATNIFIIGSSLHTLWMNLEAYGEDENLNPSPSHEIPRYLVPIALGAIAFVVNSLFRYKPATLINEFITYLNTINIAMVLGDLLQIDATDSYELSEEERLIYMLMWPSLVAIPLLYRIGEKFLSYCRRNDDYLVIDDIEANPDNNASSETSSSSEDNDADDEQVDGVSEHVGIEETAATQSSRSSSADDHETSGEEDNAEEYDNTGPTLPIARLARHTFFFTEVELHRVAGDLHVTKRFS